MNIKKIIVLVSLSLLSIGYSYNSYISPYLGYHYMDQTKNLNNSWEIGASYTQQLTETLYLDCNIGFLPTSVRSSGESTLLMGGGINALYAFDKVSLFTPYLLAGIGGVGGYEARLGLDLGMGCFINIADSFTPRLEVKNIYYGSSLGNDTIYQIIFAMPIPLQKKEPKPEIIKPLVPETKEPITPTFKNKLEEVFVKTGKVERMDMKINFDSGSSVLNPKYAESLQDYAEFLVDHPEIKLSIKGYTDSQGGKAFNQKLSELRAKAVANVLIYKYGINKNRIIVQGLGVANPVAPNNTEAGRALNRRIEASTL